MWYAPFPLLSEKLQNQEHQIGFLKTEVSDLAGENVTYLVSPDFASLYPYSALPAPPMNTAIKSASSGENFLDNTV